MNIGSKAGTIAHFSVEDMAAYADKIFADYTNLLPEDVIRGRVAELGPGELYGTLLRMLGAGACEVQAVDRFIPRRAKDRESNYYAHFADRHNLSHLFNGPPCAANIKNLHVHEGIPAETFFSQRPEAYDLIVSNAVLEHTTDPMACLSGIAAALKPGGYSVHIVDLRDHRQFTPDHHPLTFLTIPTLLYRWMTRNNGAPNRVMLTQYRQWLADSKLPGHILIRNTLASDHPIDAHTWSEIDPAIREQTEAFVELIRPKLTHPFTDYASNDLAVSVLVLVFNKPKAEPND
ncbi:MAG: methyltransferase domain-containing protein [Rhodospirillaceae bacterium]|nr:methyltransferase domain-containing protein [Rhodospirillaceae bacterium]MBT5080331.1 methyltransferase domain-containing protein [Rhodospirillaceae bacterium]MBT5525053.1 methyltransferase domain-containing protein [Rhodospirillaceae bacterium]MBT6589581.1 methyltransferase domain-containing protein [Rhodospirillaceae bacterium]MBT7666850.1 methyltransferase domain-containing protein [Rhodospirillaceae bacterium]